MKHLFAEAETSEQRVEKILHSGSSGQPVERASSRPQTFRNQHDIRGTSAILKSVTCFLDVRGLATI